MTIEDIIKDFNTDKKYGLNDTQVHKNKEKYGLNKFKEEKKVPFYFKIIEALKDPMIIILIISALISITLNIIKAINGQESEFSESIGIIVAIILSSGVTVIMEGRSQKAFQALKKINKNIPVKVIRNGKIGFITNDEIAAGDLLLLETGDKIPADGRLIESLQLEANESMLTGESTPSEKDCLSSSNEKNMVYSGTFVTSGHGKFIATAVGSDTEMGSIAKELGSVKKSSTPLQKKLGVLAKQISIAGSSAALIIFIIEIAKMFYYNKFSIANFANAFTTSIALIVAAVPEGLPTIVAISLSLNVIKMAKNNALVKKLSACETIGGVNIICSDKTGTLTKNKMTVVSVWNNGNTYNVEDMKSGFLMENFCINSTAHIQNEDGNIKFIGNPTECSLLEAFQKTICSRIPTACELYGKDNNVCKNNCIKYLSGKDTIKSYNIIRNSLKVIYQYPFSSDRKKMSTIVSLKNNFIIYSKGSPEKILSSCTKTVINNKIVDIDDNLYNTLVKKLAEQEKMARRLIAFSHKLFKNEMDWSESSNTLENDMIFDGFVSIEDPLRDDVYDAIKECRSAGISIKMLTGDNIITASSIAKKLNMIDNGNLVLEASDIDKMNDSELKEKIDKISVIARSKPSTKLRIVNMLKNLGNVVAVTGDGINDSPALKNADVGISMGITGTEVSKEASDIVLLDDSFSTIVQAVKWGRGIYENFKRFIQFQLTVNVAAVITVFISQLLGKSAPFTVLQLLWVNIIMDGPPALSLGFEALQNDLMKRPPVKRDENILDKNIVVSILMNGIFMIIMLMLLMFKNILCGNQNEQSTIIFTTFVILQLFNAFNCRMLGNKSILKNILGNKIMLITVGITFIMQVLITQFGGNFFKTVPLSAIMWCKIILYSFTIIIFSEIVKLIKRSFRRI